MFDQRWKSMNATDVGREIVDELKELSDFYRTDYDTLESAEFQALGMFVLDRRNVGKVFTLDEYRELALLLGYC